MRQLIDDIIDWLVRTFRVKEKVYETTILRDIERISELLAPKFPFDKVEEVRRYRMLREMTFRAGRTVTESLPLKTLRRTFGDTWEICLDEYESIFETQKHKYREAILDGIHRIVEQNLTNTRYHHIFIKYEDSVHTTYNTLKEYYDLNGVVELDSELFKRAHVIFISLKSALEEREGEIAELEGEKDEASNKSYLERLDQEIEYIKKYVE